MPLALVATPEPALYPPTISPPDGPLPLYQFFPAFIRNPLSTLPRQAYEDYTVVARQRGRAMIVWVTDPQLIEQILVKDADKVTKSPIEKRVFDATLAKGILLADGADWRWQRRALAPLFRPSDIASYVPAMSSAAQAQVTRWRDMTTQRSITTQTRPIDEDMLRATYDVILATMLVGGRPAEAETILTSGNAFLARASWETAYAMLRLPTWLPHPAKGQMQRAARALRLSVGAIIRRRRAEGGSPSDLLGRLLAARHPDTGEAMSQELVISNLLTLLEAGHETTAKALTWTLYLMARAPGWQAHVLDEVRAVAGNEPITAAHIERLVVTQRVIKEAMRLYPPAPVIARECIVPFELGDVAIAPGTQIVIPIFAVHRHRLHWTDPDRFDPDRFLTAAEANRPRTHYMPFGGGGRICIGAAFALTEATALLATFIRAAHFDWDGHHLPEPISRITLRPAGGMPLRVTLR
jgi:cytochrome P450